MTYKFKVGDVVKLKSGGPIMTVAEVTEDEHRVQVHCTWFNKNEPLDKTFEEGLLKQYDSSSIGSIGITRV